MFSALARPLQTSLQRLVGAFVMRVLVLSVVGDPQRPVGDETSRALVGPAQRALPEDLVGTFLHPVVDEAVLGENVELQPAFRFRPQVAT